MSCVIEDRMAGLENGEYFKKPHGEILKIHREWDKDEVNFILSKMRASVDWSMLPDGYRYYTAVKIRGVVHAHWGAKRVYNAKGDDCSWGPDLPAPDFGLAILMHNTTPSSVNDPLAHLILVHGIEPVLEFDESKLEEPPRLARGKPFSNPNSVPK